MLPRLILILTLLIPGAAMAEAPVWIHDTDRNGIDDRIERVMTLGPDEAFTDGDPVNGRLIFDVTDVAGTLTFGVYIKYADLPTETDEAAIAALGLPTHRYVYINYIRSRATFAQIQQILTVPGVLRVEALEIMYATNDNGTKTMQAQASDYEFFPTADADLGITGKGVVVAILDTGVQDEPNGLNAGHESLTGKFLGGGSFWAGDPAVNTPLTGSENPADNSPDFSHGSHVAGTAIGTGGPTGIVTDGNYGFYRGVAPDARLVDCKVLSDAGTGLGAADGLEWCIFHKDDDWGLTGEDAMYRGIQVVNMSLGGSSASDGTDASSAAVNAAVRAGLIVLVASGNDGNTEYMPAPAAADLAITVGASTDANTLDRLDDIVAGFSNEGPRAADSDSDVFDEMKPSVCAPGSGITSVEGVLTAPGDTYTTTNGTSMACPMTAGVAALIVQACPGISPAEVKRILQDTADHRVTGGKQPASAADPFGVDPNYHPSWGWGNVNAYAAVMEARFPNRTQVVKEWGTPVSGGIDIHWTTQREVDALRFHVLRTELVYGQPGAYVRVSPPGGIAPAGDPFIAGDDNRTSYVFEDRDAALTPGETYWYRVQWDDMSSDPHDEPAFPVVYDPPTPLATVYWSITHNAVDGDLLTFIGSGFDASDPVSTANFSFPAPGTGAADSSATVAGEANTGNQRFWWSRTLTDQDFGAAQVLPPGADNPWFLSVSEGGFVNRLGRIEDFRIVVHEPGGDVEYSPLTPFPVPTVQNLTSVIWIPSDPGLNLLNNAPVLDPVGNHQVQEGKTLTFTVSGSDPDGDPVTFSASNLPSGATFDAGTQTFTWSPDYSTVGATQVFNVTFEVADNSLATDSEEIEIRVHEVDPGDDLPPYFTALNDQSVVEGNTLSFKVTARDPECGSLTYTANNLPGAAGFDPATQLFTWTTTDGDAGTYQVEFTVSDGINPVVDETVFITVKGDIPPLLGICEVETSVANGVSSTGSADLGNADVDSVSIPLPNGTVRLVIELAWTVPADLDFTVYDSNGNSVGGAGSLANPEFMLVDNLPPDVYTLVVTGFLVAADTDWTATIEACVTAPVPVVLSHFASHPGEESVRLEWATSSEEDHAGFRVYRSLQETGNFERISASVIEGRGVYEFVDEAPPHASAEFAFYKLGALDRNGGEQLLGPWRVDLSSVTPVSFRLMQNAPNPFASPRGTRIRFSSPEAGEARLDVFDLQGRHVRNLLNGPVDRGQTELGWDGRNGHGQTVAGGVYFYRLRVSGKYVETRRMVVAP